MAGYIKTDGNEYSKAAAKGVPQPWNPNVPKTPDELPTFAAGDAGKVLTVNESGNGVEWAEAGGGGGGVLVVNGDMQTGALNKTVREMLDGMMTGGVVLPYNALESGGPAIMMWLYYIEEGADQYRLEFGTFGGGDSTNAFTETLDLDEYPVIDTDG